MFVAVRPRQRSGSVVNADEVSYARMPKIDGLAASLPNTITVLPVRRQVIRPSRSQPSSGRHSGSIAPTFPSVAKHRSPSPSSRRITAIVRLFGAIAGCWSTSGPV